ncbi:PD-(D/E)XK motif protein [Pseudonocardia sp. GCM10023141]|uniref:PD-(D/E)XK motif protein n=1 Tax=Pseudonocardia sp. GCM10023141 TaxID=3252653 RepID=UPI003615DD95
MSEPIKDARHYSLANVDAFWDAANPIVLPIAGRPECTLDIHPVNGIITLTTPFTPPEPDVAKWQNISFRVITSDQGDVAELTVMVEDNLHAAYGLVTSIADQVQLRSEPLAAAAATAIAKHRSMFAGKAALSQDKEVGLFGELLVLEYLIGEIGVGPAVESWQGPLNEEHDFVFNDVHLEIKTTSGEQRRHMMHGFTQLVPLRGVPLSLISVQLTRSNHEGGRTLSRIVSQLRAKSGGYRPRVDDALEAWGWKDEDKELYTTFWTKRTKPCAYDVDDRFPAFTLKRLIQVIPNMEFVSDLSYRVDVTQFTNQTLPGPLAGLVNPPEEAP